MRAALQRRSWSVECISKAVVIVLGFTSLSLFPAPAGAQPDTACAALVAVARQQRSDESRSRAMECVQNFDNAIRKQAGTAIGAEIQRLAQIPWFIPEYHDEQRLPNGEGGFGPMAFIYASPYLHGFTTAAQIVAHGTVGMLAALVHIEAPPVIPLPSTYQKLKLKRGMNCIWLAHDPTAPLEKRWSAKVSHPEPGKACDRDDPAMQPLSARQIITAAIPEDVPPVARFSQARDGQPLLGTKCLNGWCEIGPEGFAHRDPSTTVARREGKIKGWHDEQRLAEKVGDRFVPTINASVIPDANIAALNAADFGVWRRVATIELSNDPPRSSKYYRWGLRRGKNYLEIQGSGTDWRAWRARLLPEVTNTYVQWQIVGRTMHYDAAVPGTARWRWTILDDGVWVPCGQACCQAEGDI